MPPKQRITREMILETSFAMFCKDGMEIVNARSVAKALNCSTQPIFSYFAGMDDLKTALENKARDLFDTTVAAEIAGEEPLLSGCMAYFRFAMKQPNLFRQLFLLKVEKQPECLKTINDTLRENVVMPLAQKRGMNPDDLEQQCVKLWMYTHGMAALAAMGMMHLSEESVYAMVSEAKNVLMPE